MRGQKLLRVCKASSFSDSGHFWVQVMKVLHIGRLHGLGQTWRAKKMFDVRRSNPSLQICHWVKSGEAGICYSMSSVPPLKYLLCLTYIPRRILFAPGGLSLSISSARRRREAYSLLGDHLLARHYLILRYHDLSFESQTWEVVYLENSSTLFGFDCMCPS